MLKKNLFSKFGKNLPTKFKIIMKKYILIIVTLLGTMCYAQDFGKGSIAKKKKLFGLVKIGYAKPLELDLQRRGETVDISNSKAEIFSLNVVGGYYIMPKLSIGLGAGLDGLHMPSSNTFPLYGDIRYYMEEQGNSFYGVLNYGKTLRLSENFRNGNMFRIGFGYKFYTGKVCWIAAINYGKYTLSLDKNPPRKSVAKYTYGQVLGLSLGILF